MANSIEIADWYDNNIVVQAMTQAAFERGVAEGEKRGRTAATTEARPVIKALWDVYGRWCVVAGDEVDRHEMDDVCEAVEPLEERIRDLLATRTAEEGGDGG